MSKFSIEKVMKSIAKIKKRKTKDAMYRLATYCVDLETRVAVMEDAMCQLAVGMGEINGTLKEGVGKIEESIEKNKNAVYEYHFTDEVWEQLKESELPGNPCVGPYDRELWNKAYKVINKDNNCVVKIAGETVNE